METRTLGNSGLKVPVIGMGTWQTFDVRGTAAEQNARVIVDKALEAGANFFDSSPMYGEAERVLGSALEGRRQKALIATKVWTPSTEEGRDQMEKALDYFGGFVDLYQVHNLVNWKAQLDTLDGLKSNGRIAAIGATHYQSSAYGELKIVMKTGRITTIQIPYNPADREAEREILPMAADLGIGVIVMRPLGQGRLAKQNHSETELKPLAEFGVRTWAQALLKWILSDTRCHVVIPATSRPERMSENAAAGSGPWFGPKERDYVAKLALK